MTMQILAVATFITVSLPLAAHAQGTIRGSEAGASAPSPSISTISAAGLRAIVAW